LIAGASFWRTAMALTQFGFFAHFAGKLPSKLPSKATLIGTGLISPRHPGEGLDERTA
jgi:hypothetical protein